MSYKIDGLLRALLVIEILLFHFVSFFVEVFVADFVAVEFEYFVEVEGLLEFCNVATRKNIKKKPQQKKRHFIDNTHLEH